MSRVDELIRELCPDGVARKRLSSLTTKPEKINWDIRAGRKTKYIDLSSVDRKIGQISNLELIDRETAPSRAQQLVKAKDILFGTTRPLLKRVAYVPDALDGQVCSTGFCVLRVKEEKIRSRFLYHLIRSSEFFAHIETFQSGTSYPSISDSKVKDFEAPVPPLEVQDEIVRILDSFTQLEAELEAELEARRKQYEYYRDSLLSFENLNNRLGGGY